MKDPPTKYFTYGKSGISLHTVSDLSLIKQTSNQNNSIRTGTSEMSAKKVRKAKVF